MLIIFGVIVAGALVAVAYVLWQMKDDAELTDKTAKPVSLNQLKSDDLPSTPIPAAFLKSKIESVKPASKLFKKSEPHTRPPPLGLSHPATAKSAEPKKSFLTGLNLFGKKKDLNLEVPKPTPISSLKEALEIEKRLKEKQSARNKISPKPAPPTGTASLTTQAPIQPSVEVKKEDPVLSQDEEEKLEGELNASLQLAELKEKYDKVDKLLKERSEQLDHLQNSLDSELKNKREFNKVKDILEKELKDQRDKNKIIQSDVIIANTDRDGYKRRVEQLEQKIGSLEKDILKKEKEIDEISKSLQAASAALSAKPKEREPQAVESLPDAFAQIKEQSAPVEKLTAVTENLSVSQELPVNVEPTTPEPPPEPQAPDNMAEPAEKQLEPEKEGFLKLQPDIIEEDPKAPLPDEGMVNPEETPQPQENKETQDLPPPSTL